MLNYKDVTQKARLANADVIASALIAMGASFVGEDHQHDIYFQVLNGKLKFRHGTLGTLITHYERIAVGPLEKTHVYRYDANPPEAEIQQLFSTGERIEETQKIRKQYQFQNVTVHLDELPNGENYIEVEAKDTTYVTGNLFGKDRIVAFNQEQNGDFQLITDVDGEDGNDNKKAVLRHTYLLKEEQFSIVKEVKFVGTDRWIKRNEYVFKH